MVNSELIFATHPLLELAQAMDKSTAETVVADQAGPASIGDADRIRLSCQPASIKINLRGESTDSAFSSAIKSLCQLELPVVANTAQTDSRSSLLWLGPDEWQWRHAPDASIDSKSAETFITELQTRLEGVHSALVDVSDYYCIFTLQGPYVYDLLEKGSPLNVRHNLKAVSACAQTRFGQAAVLLNTVNDAPPEVHVQVRWSFAEYLWLYLREGMAEFY